MDRQGVGGIVSDTDYLTLVQQIAKADGLEPKVIYLRKYRWEADLFSFIDREQRVLWCENTYDATLEERIQLLVMPLFGTTHLKDIKAIVLPWEDDRSNDPRHREEPWGWLIERLPANIAIYRVRRRDRGEPNWLESLGSNRYGGHLPAERANT